MRSYIYLILIIILCSISNALEVNFSCPCEVNENQEFLCNIKVETNISYDIKVDILNNETRLSRIWDNLWKSSNYYITNFTSGNEEKQVKLIIENYSGNASGNLKLRKTGKTTIDYTSNFSIYVKGASKGEANNSLDNPSIQNYSYLKKNLSLEIEDIDKVEGYLFKIKISAYNLESKNYDFKVYIEDKEKIISDIYDENLSKWVSGNYYLNDYYVNQNISKTFDIKLKESYKNINGNVLLLVKIRENGKTSIILSDNRTIKLNLKEITENKSEIQPVNNLSYTENENIIKLNSNEYPEEKTIYKSSNEKIKENLLIGFCIFLIIVIIVLLIR